MALIGAEMRKLRAERLAPKHGIAAIAGMTEIKRIRHFRNEAAHQLRIAAISIAGEDQCVAADALARAVAAQISTPRDAAIRIRRIAVSATRSVEDDDIARLGGAAQAVDQFPPGAGRQAVHAQRRMARIIEVVDHVEGQAVTVRQPLDQRPRALRDRFDDRRVGLAMRLALDVGGEQSRDCRRCPWRAGSACRRPE